MTGRSTAWRLCTLGLAAALLAMLGGCEHSSVEEEEPPLMADEEAIKIVNSLSTQALVFNAISTNVQANDLMRRNPLHTLFTHNGGMSHIRQQLRDPGAREFMEYLVGCALDSSQTLTWSSANANYQGTWKGKLGLCTEWKFNKPTTACLNRVSACLLARNNAFGLRVKLSLRGEHPDAGVFALSPVAYPADFDPSTQQSPASLSSCGMGPQPAGDAGRDCGWSADFIGRCRPGQTVRLGAGGQAPDQCDAGTPLGSNDAGMSDGGVMVRVCEGIASCDSTSPRLKAASDGSCGTSEPAVSFTCPASSYFNVMKASRDTLPLAGATVGVEPSTDAGTSYPVSEQQVYRYREGAFYGNLFKPDRLEVDVTALEDGGVTIKQADGGAWSGSLPGSVYRDMYVCPDPAWTQEAAYATHRVCALPSTGANCAARVLPNCQVQCETSDGTQQPGDGDYERCHGPADELWTEPVTVYLHAPCDLMPPGAAGPCQRDRGERLPFSTQDSSGW
jgi:hypothetical protein